MSALEDKLAYQQSDGGRVAHATLAQLLKRWRSSGIDGSSIDVRRPPELVLVRTMGLETWRLVARAKSGGESVYELIERKAAEPSLRGQPREPGSEG